MEKENTNQYTRGKIWQIMLWPLHQTTSSFFMVLMMFVSYIAAGGYGIAVVTAGLIASYTRILDAVIDPFLALITDRVSTKIGKIRILMVVGRGIQILCVLILFFWGLGKGTAMYAAIYSIYVVGGTIASIATNTGNPILTNDPVQRPMVFRWNVIYTTIISSFTSVFLSKVLMAKYGKMSVPALQELCIIVVVVAVVFELLAMIAISEKDKPESFPKKSDGKEVNVKDAWKLLKGNRAMQTYIIAGVSEKVALQAASQSAINIMLFGIIIGNYAFNGTLSLINMVPTILLVFFATKFAGKKGMKHGLIRWVTVSIILAVLIVVFMAMIDPRTISKSTVPTVLFVVLFVAFNAAKTATTVCTSAMIPDIIDYEMYRSGNFMPGVVSTLYSFIDETVSSVSTTITGFCLAYIGYVTVQPQPKDPLTSAIFWMTMFLWKGLPILGWLLTLVAMKWYPLDKEMMVEVQKKNRETREAAKAKAANVSCLSTSQ
jgi:GPH family glycoside/pentoside/hexuronide:cation symporter